MSNNNTFASMALTAVLASIPSFARAEAGDFTFSAGLGYTQTPTGGLDKFAYDELKVYNDSMPGTTGFASINHHLPLLTLGAEYSVRSNIALALEVSGISSYVVGSIEDTRTTPAKATLDFGDTDQRWKQFLSLYLQSRLTNRFYSEGSKDDGTVRVFAEGGVAAAYMNADSEFSFHVLADSYEVIPWSELNLLGAYRDMTSKAHTVGITYGPTAGVGVTFPVVGPMGMEVFLGATYYFGDIDIDLKTRYPDANPKNDPSADRSKTVDGSGLSPEFKVRVRF